MQTFSYAGLPYKRNVDLAFRGKGTWSRIRFGERTGQLGPIPIRPGPAGLEEFLSQLVGHAGRKQLEHTRFYRGTVDLGDGAGILTLEERGPRAGAAYAIFEVRTKGGEAFVKVHQAWPWQATVRQFLEGAVASVVVGVGLGVLSASLVMGLTRLIAGKQSADILAWMVAAFVAITYVYYSVFYEVFHLPAKSVQTGEILFATAKDVVKEVTMPLLQNAARDSSRWSSTDHHDWAAQSPPQATW